MIINTNNDKIPKGFLLQKDYYNSLLIQSRRYKIDATPKPKNTPFLLITFDTPSNTRRMCLNIVKSPLPVQAKTRKPTLIKRPFPKAYLPNFSSIDFHFNYRTKDIYELKYIADDFNITSLNSKKFNYKETKSTNTNTFYLTSHFNKYLNSNLVKNDYYSFSRENLKKRKIQSSIQSFRNKIALEKKTHIDHT